MPTIQVLRKKLRGIRSTQKIAKAMKTASTVKFSKLNSLFGEYEKYGAEYRLLYENYRTEYDAYFAPKNPEAPECLVVIAANKGMCGSFNSELLKFAQNVIENAENPFVTVICGKKAESFFESRELAFEKAFTFGDLPKYEDALALFAFITKALAEGRISSVKIVYPKYSNMMTQTPCVCELFSNREKNDATNSDETSLFFPDKESLIKATADEMMAALIFEKILETALGAQASTLMTMRSAYDTASDYVVRLEGEINKMRQSQVTADVIETSSEFAQENL